MFRWLICLVVFGQSCTAESDFSAVIGTWRTNNDQAELLEAWRQQANGRLQGLAYHLQGSDTLLTEFMGIYEFRGQYYFELRRLHPDPKPAVLFSLTHFDDKRWVFENAGNQYPQRIVYEFPKADSLAVTLSNVQGSEKERHIGYKKVKNTTAPIN